MSNVSNYKIELDVTMPDVGPLEAIRLVFKVMEQAGLMFQVTNKDRNQLTVVDVGFHEGGLDLDKMITEIFWHQEAKDEDV